MGKRYECRDLKFDELIIFFYVLSRLSPQLLVKHRKRIDKAVERIKKRMAEKMWG